MKKLFIGFCVIIGGLILYAIFLYIRIAKLPGVYATDYSASEITRFELKKDKTCTINNHCTWSSDGIKLYVSYSIGPNDTYENVITFKINSKGVTGLNSVYEKLKDTNES